MRQRTDEQMRRLAPAPLRRRIGQLHPVPLCFLTRWVLDHCDRAALRRSARLARRAQTTSPDLTRHRRIGLPVAELKQLIEQRRGPQMRIITQPLPAVRGERLEPIIPATPTHPSLPAGQIRADRLTVPAKMTSDR
jgi:hypothetical protein